MAQTRQTMTQNLAARSCWQVARRDDVRVARHLYRKQVVDGSRLSTTEIYLDLSPEEVVVNFGGRGGPQYCFLFHGSWIPLD